MNYSGNTLLETPYTKVPKQWSGDEPVSLKTPWAGAAAALAQAPYMIHLVLSSKGHCEFSMDRGPHPQPLLPLAPESENVTQKHCLEYATNQEDGGGLTMRNPLLLGRRLRSRGAHSPLFTLCTVMGRLCKPRGQRTYPCQSVCFQAAVSPCSF